jgi:hypothetical protein
VYFRVYITKEEEGGEGSGYREEGIGRERETE